jgi:pimeloyl-ACP methyl ester carboxylesterase
VVLHWIIDYLYYFRGKFNELLGATAPKHHLGHVKEGLPPVIFIPGIDGKWSFMRHLVNKVSLNGYPVYTVPDLGNNMVSVPEGAEIVETLIRAFDLRNAVLIGHSKGGLVAKYLLAYLNKDKLVDRAITIATPFSGTKLAHINPRKGYQELRTDSQLIKDLTAKDVINNNIVCVTPAFDNHIWPQSSCYLPGARNIKVKAKGHHKVLFDKEVQDLILELLEN